MPEQDEQLVALQSGIQSFQNSSTSEGELSDLAPPESALTTVEALKDLTPCFRDFLLALPLAGLQALSTLLDFIEAIIVAQLEALDLTIESLTVNINILSSSVALVKNAIRPIMSLSSAVDFSGAGCLEDSRLSSFLKKRTQGRRKKLLDLMDELTKLQKRLEKFEEIKLEFTWLKNNIKRLKGAGQAAREFVQSEATEGLEAGRELSAGSSTDTVV